MLQVKEESYLSPAHDTTETEHMAAALRDAQISLPKSVQTYGATLGELGVWLSRVLWTLPTYTT